MAGIRPLGNVAKKWADVTPQRSEFYRTGVQNPRRDWQQEATKAEGNYQTAVTEAAAKKRYSAGINVAGTAKWQKNSVEKGPNRFMEGVRLAEGDYASNFQKYHQIIESTNLPPRFPTGDPRNNDRSRLMAQALRQGKVGK